MLTWSSGARNDSELALAESSRVAALATYEGRCHGAQYYPGSYTPTPDEKKQRLD